MIPGYALNSIKQMKKTKTHHNKVADIYSNTNEHRYGLLSGGKNTIKSHQANVNAATSVSRQNFIQSSVLSQHNNKVMATTPGFYNGSVITK